MFMLQISKDTFCLEKNLLDVQLSRKLLKKSSGTSTCSMWFKVFVTVGLVD